jgi:hypothetical protein
MSQRSGKGNAKHILNVLGESKYACDVIKHTAACAELKQLAPSGGVGFRPVVPSCPWKFQPVPQNPMGSLKVSHPGSRIPDPVPRGGIPSPNIPGNLSEILGGMRRGGIDINFVHVGQLYKPLTALLIWATTIMYLSMGMGRIIQKQCFRK